MEGSGRERGARWDGREQRDKEPGSECSGCHQSAGRNVRSMGWLARELLPALTRGRRRGARPGPGQALAWGVLSRRARRGGQRRRGGHVAAAACVRRRMQWCSDAGPGRQPPPQLATKNKQPTTHHQERHSHRRSGTGTSCRHRRAPGQSRRGRCEPWAGGVGGVGGECDWVGGRAQAACRWDCAQRGTERAAGAHRPGARLPGHAASSAALRS